MATPSSKLRLGDFEREDDIAATPIPLVIGVTGHRDLVARELPVLEQLVRAFFQDLRSRYPELPLEVLNPLAEGADRLVAKVALEFDARLIVPLPMRRETYLEDFSDRASREEFQALVRRARVFTLPEWALPRPAQPDQIRDLQYAQLGVFIASHCHILLALWDGVDNGQVGGTAQVIEYHQRDYMPGISEQRAGLSLNLVNDESDLVFHVTCSRRQHPNDMQVAAGTACWLTADETNPRTPDLPHRYDQVFKRIAEFNADAEAHQDHIEREAWPLSYEGDAVPESARRIEQVFKAADWLALRYQRWMFNGLRTMLIVGAAAGFCFVAFADLPDQDLMIYPYLGFFAIGIAVFFVLDRGAWHRRYLDYRVLAESLRVQFYWAVAGVMSPTPTKYNHDSYLAKQDVELGWIRHVLRFTGRRADALLEPPDSAGISLAIERWIGEQQAFFEHRATEKSKVHERNVLISGFCFWVGIVIALTLALAQYSIGDAWKSPMMALMGMLPLIAGGRLVYSNLRADTELIKQYSFMQRIMKEALRRIESTHSDDDRREILRALGETALDEQAEWIMRLRQRHPDSQELA